MTTIIKPCIACGNVEPHYASRQGRCIKCYTKARNGSRVRSPRGPGRPPRDDGLKRCPACRNVKPLDQFAESETSKDGRRYRCLACDRERDSSVLFCEECCGQSWRRPRSGTCRCGLEYEPERMPTAVDRLRSESSAAQWSTVGDSELTNFHSDESGEYRKRGVSAPPEYRQPMPRMRRSHEENPKRVSEKLRDRPSVPR